MTILSFKNMLSLFPQTILSMMNVFRTKETIKTKKKLKIALIFKPKNYQLKAKGMLEQSELQNSSFIIPNYQTTNPEHGTILLNVYTF